MNPFLEKKGVLSPKNEGERQSLSEMIAKAVEKEYTKKQKERYEKLHNNMITSTEISGICERKFIFSRRNPEIKPDRAGISTLALFRQCSEMDAHH